MTVGAALKPEPGKIAELEVKHPGWRIWLTNLGHPWATRRGNVSFPPDMTLAADSWADLEAQLADQNRPVDPLQGI